ncbi:MAG TPA: heme o synthase [Acidimicrobiales bacterium]|jgi:protoheme IX farnesyltransferase|nr:heme o synthase [Acidimicrobiales bacterium]HJL90031.1 heme o synthase [Acidimicrobiales bacterium]HJO98324.1 heme o synthase [Acidimicrobiales bacterium]|tara:strand:+ start:1832 stop:2716 length:885 start_codon:yes stop_codon:yes gene_type:complete
MLAPPSFTLRARLAGYVALTKPRIVELLLVTTVPTMFVAENGVPSIWLMVATVLGGTLAAGGANAVNMVVDRDIDSLMERTSQRPLVRGVMTPRAAMVFAVIIETVAFAWLVATVNLLSAVLAVSATLFYVFIYTLWLKRSTTRNIVIGGAAGAAPVLIGWSAVTNSLAWAPVVLFLVIFYWTPPHFWALAIRYREDYLTAGVPMLPSVVSLRATSDRILYYTAVMVALTVVFWLVAGMGVFYLVSALVLGAAFVAFAVAVRRNPNERTAMRLFSFSITYVTLLFGAIALDVVL